MYCLVCGYLINDNYNFCSHCGAGTPNEVENNLSVPPVEPIDFTETAETVPTPVLSPLPFTPTTYQYEERSMPAPFPFPSQEEARLPAKEPEKEFEKEDAKDSAKQEQEPIIEEKYFFGKPALVACLILIGILSVTTAMFAGLFINEIGGFGALFKSNS